MKFQRSCAVCKIMFGKYFLMFTCMWVFFSPASQVMIPDSGGSYFLSLASENILLQKLANPFNQTAAFSAPKEK